MDINPFELLKNAQSLQQQAKKAQEMMAQITATGTSGGGIVSMTINGEMEILDLHLDPIAVDPRDVNMLQDLIIAAHRDAVAKVKETLTAQLGPLVKGLNIPGLHL